MNRSHVVAGGLTVGLLTLCVGCTPTNWDDPMGEPVEMQTAEFPPPESARPQVVLMKAANVSGAREVHDGPARAAQLVVSNLITSAGAAVVDRTLPRKLESELQRIERGGVSALEIKGATDVVRVQITKIANSTQFTEASSRKDGEGRTVRVPASCAFTSQVAGTLQIYGTTPLSVRETFYFSGQDSGSVDMNNSKCPLEPGRWLAMAEEAVRSAVAEPCLQNPFKNALAPVGYVMERRRINGTDYFRTSLTPQLGAKDGEDAEIWQQRKERDPVKGETSIRRVKVAEGEFEDEIGGLILVEVDDPARADLVQVGDLVKVHYSVWYDEYIPTDVTCKATASTTGPSFGPMLKSLLGSAAMPAAPAARPTE